MTAQLHKLGDREGRLSERGGRRRLWEGDALVESAGGRGSLGLQSGQGCRVDRDPGLGEAPGGRE